MATIRNHESPAFLFDLDGTLSIRIQPTCSDIWMKWG